MYKQQHNLTVGFLELTNWEFNSDSGVHSSRFREIESHEQFSKNNKGELK